MVKKPQINIPPAPARVPVPAPADRPICWAFSFRFWRQIEYFGLDHSDPKWFVSVLEKLAELSRDSVDGFLADGARRDAWRYHDISWTQTNIPIQRSDLNWLDRAYLDNAAEFPLVQFQISTALGRVVGFWDEKTVFNVVLLDPLHNIQPSKHFNYKVNPCSPLPCLYSTLLHDVRLATDSCPFPDDCKSHQSLSQIPSKHHYHNVVILRLTEEDFQDASDLFESQAASSFEDLLQRGILSAVANAPQTQTQSQSTTGEGQATDLTNPPE